MKIIRFNELKRNIGTISFKTLSVMLKKLEADDIIIRKEYQKIPPKVEYSFSERSRSPIPVLDMMRYWGGKN